TLQEGAEFGGGFVGGFQFCRFRGVGRIDELTPVRWLGGRYDRAAVGGTAVGTIVHVRAVASAGFGGVKGGVGALNERLDLLVGFDRCQAAADGNRDRLVVVIQNDLARRLAHLAADEGGLFERRIRKQDGELLAAVTGDGIFAPHGGTQRV